MPVPQGLTPPASFAFVVRAGFSVPDCTTVTGVSLSVLYPDGTTTATWTATVPATVPPNVKGFEALAGTPNPVPNYLIGVHVFSAGDGISQTGTYLIKPLLTVSGYAQPIPAKTRPLVVTSAFGDQ